MTLVAVNAVVDISRHVVVLEIVPIVVAVTSGALEDRVVIRIRMAGRTGTVRIAMPCREGRVLRVVESCTRPRCSVVTRLAGGRKELRLSGVTRIGRVVVVRLMATNAGRWQRRVVVVHVAVRTHSRRHEVRASEGEGGVVVIKSGIRPRSRIVADFARRRKTRSSVCRIICTRVVLLVAGVAQGAV